MAIGLSDSTLTLSGLDAPRLLPRAAVDALAQLDDDALRAVVDAAAAQTLDRSHSQSQSQNHTQAREGDEEDSHQLLAAETVDRHREATAAATCVLVHCARETADPTRSSLRPLRQAVVDCGIDNELLLARLVPLLVPYIAAVRAVLQASSFDFAHVVDVTWRLDYVLRSSVEGNVHEPVYYVQLKVQPPQGAVHDVAFACSVEGLRDLVYRLQDATNALEKLARPSSARPAAAAAIA